MTDFSVIVELLGSWPARQAQSPKLGSSIGQRLLDALDALRDPEREDPGPLDLAGLVSHVLHREAALHPDAALQLRVPRHAPWPSPELWRRCGCEVALQTAVQLCLRPQTWQPEWLPDLGPEAPLLPALREDARRRMEQVPADPAIAELCGQNYYLGPGQRAAVRAAMLLQPGESLLVVLPTGGGKSLTVFGPARIQASVPGLTLVVVPTVALAIDLGRRAAAMFRNVPEARDVGQWAYHGGLDPEHKAAIRQRIREGRQPIVFASPEAVMLSLRPSLLAAAREGLLRSFVIDEAHLVAQWGDEFRPDFQVLAGVRQALLAACPEHARFRTLLLTATLTEETWWTLRTLFGTPELEVCASVSLRPEPDYYVLAVDSEAERIERVQELVAVLPRPFILYTTTRTHAVEWAARIRQDGLHRVDLMTGATPAADREVTLRRWAAHELDVMVATSAFGLGMDQSDVRAVVHACVPETVDRFYQEVGRGGRDGRACLSFLVHTPEDLRIAERLSQDRIIGIDKGLARWRAMYRDRIQCDNDAVLVPLDAKHDGVQGDSDANVAWNLRTLVLMARSGMLHLQAHSPPQMEQMESEDDETYARRRELAFREYARLARVKPKNLDHLDRNTWTSMVESSRQASRRADQQAHRQVLRLLSGDQSFASLFGETYRVPDAGILPAQGVGNCPASRRAGLARRVPEPPEPEPLHCPIGKRGDALLRLCRDQNPLLVACPPQGETRRALRAQLTRLFNLMQRLVALGIREIAAEHSWLEQADFRALYHYADPPLVLHSSPDESPGPPRVGLQVPRLSLLHVGCTPQRLAIALELKRPAHIILLPEELDDLHHPARRFFDTRSKLTFDELIRRLDRWGS